MTQKKTKRLTGVQVLTEDFTSYKIRCKSLKVSVCYIFASLFFTHFKSSFRSGENQILES